MRRVLVLAAFLLAATGCWHRARILPRQAIAGLAEKAAADLGCSPDDLEIEPRTLLTRRVRGCDRQVVYAYDPAREIWILDTDETAAD